MAEGCHIELEFILLALTEEDVKTELKCFTQNRGGRQEAVTQLQIEGEFSVCGHKYISVTD